MVEVAGLQPEPEATEEPSPVQTSAPEPDNWVEDEEDFDEGYESMVQSSFKSITSSLHAHTYENGRRYHQYRHGRYPLPNDDIEQNREDMKHAIFLEITNGKLFLSPIGKNPQNILDLGTGIGIWCIDGMYVRSRHLGSPPLKVL